MHDGDQNGEKSEYHVAEHPDSKEDARRKAGGSGRLIDWVVGLALVLFLLALVLPIFESNVRTGEYRASCLNNIRQVVLAAHNYSSANETFPRGSRLLDDEIGQSFLVSLLSFMDQDNLYKEYKRGLENTEPEIALMNLSKNQISVFLCQSSNQSDELANGIAQKNGYASHYIGSLGPNSDPDKLGFRFSQTDQTVSGNPPIGLQGVFSPRVVESEDESSRVRFGHGFGFEDFTDGSSNTVALFESSQGKSGQVPMRQGWAFGHIVSDESLTIEHIFSSRSTVYPINAPIESPHWNSQPLGSNHPGGCNVAMADGSSRFLSEEVDTRILRAVSGMNDGIIVDTSQW